MKRLLIVLTLALTACSQATAPPTPVATTVDTPAPTAPAPTNPVPVPDPATPAPTPAAPCRLLAVWDAEGVTRATIGPRCPTDEWVMVVNLATGSHGASVVAGWPAQVTAGATAPGMVLVSGGVVRE